MISCCIALCCFLAGSDCLLDRVFHVLLLDVLRENVSLLGLDPRCALWSACPLLLCHRSSASHGMTALPLAACPCRSAEQRHKMQARWPCCLLLSQRCVRKAAVSSCRAPFLTWLLPHTVDVRHDADESELGGECCS